MHHVGYFPATRARDHHVNGPTSRVECRVAPRTTAQVAGDVGEFVAHRAQHSLGTGSQPTFCMGRARTGREIETPTFQSERLGAHNSPLEYAGYTPAVRADAVCAVGEGDGESAACSSGCCLRARPRTVRKLHFGPHLRARGAWERAPRECWLPNELVGCALRDGRSDAGERRRCGVHNTLRGCDCDAPMRRPGRGGTVGELHRVETLGVALSELGTRPVNRTGSGGGFQTSEG